MPEVVLWVVEAPSFLHPGINRAISTRVAINIAADRRKVIFMRLGFTVLKIPHCNRKYTIVIKITTRFSLFLPTNN